MDLNKDGLICDLYHLLWKKEDFMKTNEESFRLKIPHTLVIKGSQPFAWYFTDSEGFLRRKRTQKLNLTEIYNVFAGNSQNIDVVAYFFHQEKVLNSFSSI